MVPHSLTKKELREALVRRDPDDHKGVYGHVLIVAGSRSMAGAAILATRAALRSGAGLVTAAVPYAVAPILAGAVPSAMTLPLPENTAGALRPEGIEKLKSYVRERGITVCALGPGLSLDPDVGALVPQILSGLFVPAVVDADALNGLAGRDPAAAAQLLKTRRHPCVFTPHPAELSRVLRCPVPKSEPERVQAAERLARDWGGVALLKGQRTVIASGVRTIVNTTGGTGLSKAGSGDVLTGLIAGLWAQALASGRLAGDLGFQAAALGAWLHGTAGDLAEKEMTPWAVTSSDVVEFLPRAFAKLLP